MKLNTDDTKVEKYINSRHLETDVLLNCENCKRCFYADSKWANKRVDAGISILCARCKSTLVDEEEN